MPRFFISAGQRDGEHVTITGADARHLRRSLRIRGGETIVVVEGGAVEHGVRVDSLTDAAVSGVIAWSRPAAGEPSLRVTAVLATAAQHMDRAVEALVVAGAAAIQPVLTERSVSRPDASRVERWRSVALNAAQLSGRATAPVVGPLLTLRDAVDGIAEGCRILACMVDPTALPIRAAPAGRQEVAVVIGPEGGLGPGDRSLLAARSAGFVHLGPRTFPHHLAGAVAVSLLLAGAGDLDSTPPSP